MTANLILDQPHTSNLVLVAGGKDLTIRDRYIVTLGEILYLPSQHVNSQISLTNIDHDSVRQRAALVLRSMHATDSSKH